MTRESDIDDAPGVIPGDLDGLETGVPHEDDIGHVTYVERVTSLFLALRGTGLFLSPRDMETILEWWDAGLPLSTVLRGMARGAERLHARNQPIRSLGRLKRHVTAAHRGRPREAWTAADRFGEPACGRANAIEPGEKRARIDALIDDHLEALRALERREPGEPAVVLDAAREAVTSLEEVRVRTRQQPGDRAAGAILEVGRKFYRRLLAGLPEDARAGLKAQARASLRGWADTMSDEAAGDTLEELMIVLLRERYEMFEPGRVLALWEP